MALPLFQVPSSLLRAYIKPPPPLLCSTASTSTPSPHFHNPFTNPNARFLRLIKTCVSSSVAEAEAEAAPTAIEKEEEPKNRLIAQNIPWDTTVDDIRALFEEHGTVVDVEVSMYNKRKNRGLAFITMSSEEEALTALNNLDNTEFGGRKIGVDFARSQKKQPPQGPKKKYSVFVGNLSFKVRSKDLKEFFQKDGSVVSAQIIFNSKPRRRSAGYGFITFYSKEEAEVAIETFNGKELMGRPVRMGFAKDISPEETTKEIPTEETTGDSAENETIITADKTENNTSVDEEKTVNV